MTRDEITEIAGTDVLMFLGTDHGEFDHTIAGVTLREEHTVLVYDTYKIIEFLEHGGMSFEDAWEYFNFNIEGAHMGDLTPIFITPIDSPPVMH